MKKIWSELKKIENILIVILVVIVVMIIVNYLREISQYKCDNSLQQLGGNLLKLGTRTNEFKGISTNSFEGYSCPFISFMNILILIINIPLVIIQWLIKFCEPHLIIKYLNFYDLVSGEKL